MVKRGITLFLGLLFLSFIGVRNYFTFNRPAVAQPSLGRVVAIELNYNKTVYVTRGEGIMLNLTGELPVIFTLVMILAINHREIARKIHAS